MKPVCLVIGAGAGIGGNVARRFAREGYHACLCRRSDLDGLNRMVSTIKDDGGSATGFLLNAIEANAIEERVAAIEADIAPHRAILQEARRGGHDLIVMGVSRWLGSTLFFGKTATKILARAKVSILLVSSEG